MIPYAEIRDRLAARRVGDVRDHIVLTSILFRFLDLLGRPGHVVIPWAKFAISPTARTKL